MIDRKKRLIYFSTINIGLLCVALFLVWLGRFVAGTPLALATDCPSHIFFDIYCPFCGGTRAIRSLLKFDIMSSLIYNPAVLPAAIAFLVYDILTLKAIIQNKEHLPRVHKPVWISISVILVLNWIIRNILLIVWDIDYMVMLP